MIRYFFQLFLSFTFLRTCRPDSYRVHGFVFTLSFLSFLSFRGAFVKALLAAVCYCACLPSTIIDGSAC